MIGIVAWLVWSVSGYFLLRCFDLFPSEHPGCYAASLLLVLSGMTFGGVVNQYIRDNCPNLDKWNC